MNAAYKVVFQGTLLLLGVLMLFVLLMGVDWAGLTHAEEHHDETAERVGRLMREYMLENEEVLNDTALTKPVYSLIYKICHENGIEDDSVDFHILLNNEVNAFALPGRQLVIYTGLLKECRNESELAGVLAHEIAHIEANHVMKKLAKELGFSMLSTLTSGGQAIGMVFETLGSTAYDRDLETQADLAAVYYMQTAGLNPRAYADVLYRIAGMQGSSPEVLDWISTHPDAEARAETVLDAINPKFPVADPVLSDTVWAAMKARL